MRSQYNRIEAEVGAISTWRRAVSRWSVPTGRDTLQCRKADGHASSR
jgi:hypothetical protein